MEGMEEKMSDDVMIIAAVKNVIVIMNVGVYDKEAVFYII